MRIGILASHPIQYQAPWFRALARETELMVYFAHRQSAQEQAEAGFGVAFDWDVDLLSGYSHEFLRNVSPHPSVNDFAGCDTPQIREIIAREKFDAFIVCGWYLKSFLQAVRACRRIGTPVFIRGDSQLVTPHSGIKRLLKEITHRALLRRFDGFLYVGQRNAEYLRHYGAAEERMFFVPHFVDNEWFGSHAAAARESRREQRSRWGADATTLVALFVGKLISKKRPADLIRAVARLPNTSQKVIAVFVGSGELEGDLRNLGRELGVLAHFEGFKNQSELPTHYASADVLVLPSDGYETWGLVVNEAMACDVPAIVSNAVGCGPDLIQEGQTGFTYPVGDVATLSECLTNISAMLHQGYDFRRVLRENLHTYSLSQAVLNTVNALSLVTDR